MGEYHSPKYHGHSFATQAIHDLAKWSKTLEKATVKSNVLAPQILGESTNSQK